VSACPASGGRAFPIAPDNYRDGMSGQKEEKEGAQLKEEKELISH